MRTSASSPHQTAPQDRVPLVEKIALGLGYVAGGGPHLTLHVLTNPIFNVTMGLSPALISTVTFIQRIWDAMTDPIIGQYSDNVRSRWGRRRPLLAAAAVPMAAFFALLWWFPRDSTQTGLFLFLLIGSLLFYAVQAVYIVPLAALQLEATADYHERTRVAAFVQILAFFFFIGAQWTFPFTQLAIFGDTIEGVRWLAVLLGAGFLVLATMPVIFCRERVYAQVAQRERRSNFRNNLREAMRNEPFVQLLLLRCLSSFGYNIVGTLGLYINYYYIFRGDIRSAAVMQAWNGTAMQISSIAGLFFFRWFATRRGKRAAMLLAAFTLIIAGLCKMVVYTPALPPLQLIVYVLNGIGTSGIAMLATSMLADVADYDEWKSHQRREGFYVSILNWFDKMGTSVGVLIAGFVLVWIGFDATRGGDQSPQTLWLMRVLYVIFPLLGASAAAFTAWRYSLNEKQVHAIKEEIGRRRPST